MEKSDLLEDMTDELTRLNAGPSNRTRQITAVKIPPNHINEFKLIESMPVLPRPFYDPASSPASPSNFNKGFFKLPTEIRRMIYNLLWPPEDSVHVEYLYKHHPIQKSDTADTLRARNNGTVGYWYWSSDICHFGVDCHLETEDERARFNYETERAKNCPSDYDRWSHCHYVCAGNAYPELWDLKFVKPEWDLLPKHRRHRARRNDQDECAARFKKKVCRLKDAAWIRTCKQAYLDAIPYIYSRSFILRINYFDTTWRHIGNILPPANLAFVTGLQLGWTTDERHPDPRKGGNFDSEDTTKAGWSDFPQFLKMLRQTFSSLKDLRLEIGVFANRSFPELPTDEQKAVQEAVIETVMDEFLFKPMDQFVAQMGDKLEYCVLSVPQWYYWILERRPDALRKRQNHVQEIRPGTRSRAYREMCRAFWHEIKEGDGILRGYWVDHHIEMLRLLTTSHCP